jgi:hypothetical protein
VLFVSAIHAAAACTPLMDYDAMDVVSVVGSQHSKRSHRSKSSASSMSSLLSDKSLERVFGLIDDFYHGRPGDQPPTTADLLGNYGPAPSQPPPGRLDALALVAERAADSGRQSRAERGPSEGSLARVLAVAKSDAKGVEELIGMLSNAKLHANATGGMSLEQLQVSARALFSHRCMCAHRPHRVRAFCGGGVRWRSA